MEVIDISREIKKGMEIYPGDPKLKIEAVKDFDKDGLRLSKIEMGLHSGTHIDAPSHYLKDGKSLGLESWVVGPAIVCSDVSDAAPGKVALLNKELSEEDADIIINRSVPVVGVGKLSVGSPKVHKKLLFKGIVIIEGLELSSVKTGEYTLLCLPLKIDAEAAPARCVLIKG